MGGKVEVAAGSRGWDPFEDLKEVRPSGGDEGGASRVESVP